MSKIKSETRIVGDEKKLSKNWDDIDWSKKGECGCIGMNSDDLFELIEPLKKCYREKITIFDWLGETSLYDTLVSINKSVKSDPDTAILLFGEDLVTRIGQDLDGIEKININNKPAKNNG